MGLAMNPNPRIVDKIEAALIAHLRDAARRPGSDPTMTYGELVSKANLSILPRGLGPYLSALGDRCKTRGQPRLDALVVTQRTRRPGASQWDGTHWKIEVDRCVGHPAYRS